ncbi:hypothetical protein RFN28_00855 [Mesorhizobium sp. VK24D]|uniref:DUF3102 domain-containing protein n=1 Tax=Mesorhizobium album TaxID=3072314 RepID=A0ABU4XT48_9HYPH|nr:hypothetical protein [Mesorhizobium sp. VK24D]MDX8477020.1 hypothetical protein [Mesorhizobium sp. VK24D]
MSLTLGSQPTAAISAKTIGHSKAKPPKAAHFNTAKAKAEMKAELAKPDAVSPAFDYSQIESGKVRAKAQAIANRIRANVRATEKNLLANGRELLAIKEDLGRGLFGPWVEAEFRWTARTAQNYIAVAERVADNYHYLTYLPSPTIYRLAAKTTPDALRLDVINAAKNNTPKSKDEVERLISEANGKAGKDGKDSASQVKVRKTAAAKAVDTLRAELSDFDGFMMLVGEAGREFINALRMATHGTH